LDPVNLISLPPEFLHSFGGFRGILNMGSENPLMAPKLEKHFNEEIIFHSIGVINYKL
jgi:hypothetical protein